VLYTVLPGTSDRVRKQLEEQIAIQQIARLKHEKQQAAAMDGFAGGSDAFISVTSSLTPTTLWRIPNVRGRDDPWLPRDKQRQDGTYPTLRAAASAQAR
jgi:hypothetical protein